MRRFSDYRRSEAGREAKGVSRNDADVLRYQPTTPSVRLPPFSLMFSARVFDEGYAAFADVATFESH